MIKPNEAVVLAELRKTTLAYLSDADFKEVEKAVERDGILSLKGSVATVVKDAVLKHGSHNQSSHGKKGGGGSGGGGGSTSSTANSPEADAARTKTAKSLERDMTEAISSLDDASSRESTPVNANQIARSIGHFRDAKADFKAAKGLKGKAQTEKIQSGVDKAAAGLSQLSITEGSVFDDIGQNILDEVTATFGDSKTAMDELGIDLDNLMIS